jgi:predicted PurR-regulated permease PerM
MQLSDSQKWMLLTGTALVAVLVYLLAPVLFPFLVASALAYLGDPLVDRLEARKLSRTLSVVLVFCGLFLALFIVIAFVVPALQQELVALVKKLPGYIDWLQARLAQIFGTVDLASLKAAIREHWQSVGGVAAGLMGSVSRSGLALVGWFANLVLIPVLTFYLLRDWDVLVARIHELIPRRYEEQVVRLARDCDEVLGAFMHGQLLVMLALGSVYSLGLWLVGLDMAFLIGMLAGLVSFVPYLGFILGIAVAGVAALMQFHDIIHLFYILLVFGVGQALESFLLTPYLLGDRIGLHPVAVIFAVMAGGQLFGFAGVLLALPTAAVIMVLLRHAHERYVNSQLYGAFEGGGAKEATPPTEDKVDTDESESQ